MESIFIFSSALIISLFSIFYIRKISIKYKIGSLPNSRKIHSGFIPTLGGIGIFAGVVMGIFVSLIWKEYYWNMFSIKYIGIAVASFLMLATGIYDDLKKISPIQKFLMQIIAATIIIIFESRISVIINPFGEPFELGLFAIPVTYLWIIGITNSINLLDGLDGLAAGVSLIVVTSIGIISFYQQDWMTFAICLALIGSLIGFLRYNYHPANIFMGDAGSLFLGFLISAITLEGMQESKGNIALLVPIIVLSVPLGDSVLAFFRRLLKGKHPFRADKDHLHHRLIDLGLSHKQAVHVIYLASILFATAAYLISSEEKIYGLLMLFLVMIIIIISLNRLGYLEAQKKKVYLGDDQIIKVKSQLAPLSMKRLWHKLLLFMSDIIAINIALIFLYWIKFESGIFSEIGFPAPGIQSFLNISIISTFFFVVLFALNGLYNIKWDLSRFDILLKTSRIILFGGFIIFIITLDPSHILSASRLSIIIFIAILILLINGLRLFLIYIEKQFSLLEYSSHKTLLVGTSDKAKKILKDIRNNKHLLYDIVGIVTREQNGATLSNLKNIGNYEDIPKLIFEHGIEEIIIAINERSRDEVLNVVAYGENMGVSFKIIPQMYDVISGHKTEEIIGHPLIRIFPDQMLPWQWLLKRMLDLFFAITGLVILSPLFILVFIFQVSSGIFPFFVIENKVGKQGKMFGQLLLNTNNRNNITGQFLYLANIYKLPQVLNLFLGSLSLVGPRPENLKVVGEMRNKIKFYNRRFMVRPGITGWAQVKYRYSESLKHRKEQFKQDLFYLENMSILFDFRIIIRSVYLFFFKR
jgi:UDP-GlcNAc:undecaprenyl-phosphate/decaprenyl-phosphate GlcNAc-1-phosphate transferase